MPVNDGLKRIEMMNKNRFVVLSIVVAVVLLSVPMIMKSQEKPDLVANVKTKKEPVSGEGIPVVGGPFTLVDQHGQTRTDKDFRGKPMLVYFGYTYCPDICPMGLSTMSKVAEAFKGFVQPIFVTIDPQRDTPEQLALYAQNFHPDFVMLSGDKPHIDEAMKNYRVYGARASEDRGASDYLMDHSSLVYFMDEKGIFQLHFNHQTSPEDMIKGIQEWMNTRGDQA